MTTPTPRWTAEEIERIGREITHGWMAHLGYTPEQVTEYEMNNQHERAGCEFTSEGWFCLDEDEKSLHPGYDELRDVAELVMFVLEHPALAGVLTAVGGETILVRDCPGADCRRHPFGEHTHSRTVTSYPDGSQHFGPWREVTDDPASMGGEPMPPEKVRAVMADGREIPLDLTYAGFKETGPDHHQHVWTTPTRLPGPPTELKIGMLPANTTVRMPMMVRRREREWNE